MKKILIPVMVIASMTAFSFKPVSSKIVKLADGNYYIPKGVVSADDAKLLSHFVVEGESDVSIVSTKVFMTAVDKTVTQSTDGVKTTATTATATTKGAATKGTKMTEYAIAARIESVLAKYE